VPAILKEHLFFSQSSSVWPQGFVILSQPNLMIMQNTNIFRFLPVLLLMGVGCDLVTKDTAPQLESTVYTLDAKPMVFNVNTISGGRDLVIKKAGTSSNGSFEMFQDGKYLLFRPNASFSGSQERVSVELVDRSTSKIFSELDLTLQSLNSQASCREASGIYDYLQIKKGETVELDLLDNDIFCNVAYNGGFISEIPIEEGADTNDFLLTLGPGRKAKLQYTPRPGFTGRVKIMYNLGINWLVSGNNIPPNAELLTNPKKYFEAFSTALVEIDVVEQ
jgi:hypothetical protein